MFVVVTDVKEVVVASPWHLSPIPVGSSWHPRIASLTLPQVPVDLQLEWFAICEIFARTGGCEHDDYASVGH